MSNILYETEKGVATITLNRPDRMNAYNIALHDELLETIDKADTDNSVRAIVVTGAGRAYCAGADIEMGFVGGGLSNNDMEIDGIRRDYGGVLNLRIFDCDTPIIAAVNGHAIGIGATMLLPMDIKIASSKAKFGFPFARRGIVFDGAASFFLPRIVGLSKAQEWIATGRTLMADEVLSAGMVSEVVEPEKVLERAYEIARDIAVNVSPESAARNKQLIRSSLYGNSQYGTWGMTAHMDESKHLMHMFQTDDCTEGVTAFLEKREPSFKDRS